MRLIQTYKKMYFLESRIWAKIRLNIKTIPTTVVHACVQKRNQKGAKDIPEYSHTKFSYYFCFSFFFLLIRLEVSLGK